MITRLTERVKSSGCAAKFPAKKLQELLSSLPKGPTNPNLLAGFDNAEDAFCYKVSDDLIMIETVDFFPPMVDDPYTFGCIAAANALSDIYAMGAEPKTALSLLCFPSCLDMTLMKELLKGGIDKCKEAGVVIAGGHTIADEEPKYGLCVTGFSRIDEIWYNNNVKKGDVLVLTKKLGAGIINTAAKANVVDKKVHNEVLSSMMRLNKYARDIARTLDVSACTDVTGFGLIGHLSEMMSKGEFSALIESSKIKIFDTAISLAEDGIIPEGMYNNIDYAIDKVDFDRSIKQSVKDILFDPQTSGGLLFSMTPNSASEFIAKMPEAYIIGSIVDKRQKPIQVV